MTEETRILEEYLLACEEESRENLQKFADQYHIKNIDEDALCMLSNVRRPLVLVRGKPVTVEQTMQIISGEEPLFGGGARCEGCYFDPREDRGVLKNIFYRSGYDWLSTWLYSDGTIGGDLIFLGKYPEWDEMLLPYMHLAATYPFLDMVIAYTIYNECTCFGCDALADDICMIQSSDCKCKDCAPYLSQLHMYKGWNKNPAFNELYFRSWGTGHVRSDVGDSVAVTIWIHNGKTDLLFRDQAGAKFREYNQRYCAPEYAFMFSADLYNYHSTCICNKEFVGDCFEYIGKPRSLCDEYVERKFISPFNENATVVTKEWVIEQYHKYIAGK